MRTHTLEIFHLEYKIDLFFTVSETTVKLLQKKTEQTYVSFIQSTWISQIYILAHITLLRLQPIPHSIKNIYIYCKKL